jgi:hypothetical protein
MHTHANTHTHTRTHTTLPPTTPGEVVVAELIDRFGRLKKRWPKKLLRSLEERNAALLAAISERVCFVPKARGERRGCGAARGGGGAGAGAGGPAGRLPG